MKSWKMKRRLYILKYRHRNRMIIRRRVIPLK